MCTEYYQKVLSQQDRGVSLKDRSDLQRWSLFCYYLNLSILEFLPKDNVHSVMLGQLIIHTSKDHQSYFLFPSEIPRLASALKYLKVFGSDSETNVYKPFVELFPSAKHLLCDLHMKDNLQSKLSDI